LRPPPGAARLPRRLRHRLRGGRERPRPPRGGGGGGAPRGPGGAGWGGEPPRGLGGGGLVPVTLALVADTWLPQRRGLPLGVVGAVQELGSVIGPLHGAAVVAGSGWRTIFWVNLPVALVLGAGFRPLAGEAARRRAGA